MLKLICSMAVAMGLVVLTGCGDGHDHSSHDHGAPAAKSPETPTAPVDPNAKPYPLQTCVVSGQKLGSMGEPMRFTYKGQEIKLCCKGCEKKFQADADKFLEKIAAGGK